MISGERWRPLLATGLAYRFLAATLIAPLYAGLLRIAVAFSGDRVLTDQDLLYFVRSPLGLVGLFLIGSAAVAIAALEVAALLAVFGQPKGATSAKRVVSVVSRRAPAILRVTARLVAHLLAWLAPAVAVAAATYALFLNRYDINYYLAVRPAAFWWAVVIAIGIAAYLVAVAMRLAVAWFLALPIALYEEVGAAHVYHTSRERTWPYRWPIRGWLFLWATGAMLATIVGTTLVVLSVGGLIPLWPRTLAMAALGVGLALGATLAVNVAVNLLGTIALVALLYRIDQRLSDRQQAIPKQLETDATSWLSERLTTQRLAVSIALTLFAAFTFGYIAIATVTIDDEVIVIAHRGAPRTGPGNTLATLNQSIADGVEWVEIDVQESADGEVIVFHDSDFMKVAGIDLKVWQATADDLAQINVNPSADGAEPEPVPTLLQVLEFCREKVGVVIELKYYGHDAELEQRVVDAVEQAGMAESTMLMSLHRPSVKELQRLRPNWRVGQLLSVAVGSSAELDADFLGLNSAFANRKAIDAAHRRGSDIYVWTVNDPVQMSVLVSRGVDGLITDRPTVAADVLAQRESLPPVTRLMIDLADRFQLAALWAPIESSTAYDNE